MNRIDRKAVEVMSQVSQKLAFAKFDLFKLLRDKPKEYFDIKDLFYDCEELMGKYCDCAPIKLINGKIDDIMTNLEESHMKWVFLCLRNNSPEVVKVFTDFFKGAEFADSFIKKIDADCVLPDYRKNEHFHNGELSIGLFKEEK